MTNPANGINVISLILLPTTTDVLPPMLIHHKVAWRHMPPASAKAPGDISQAVNDRLTEAVSSGNLNKLIGRAKSLYTDIVPVDAQRILWEVGQQGDTILLIHNWPRHDWIPWEIMHDDDEFLGLKFQITRMPVLTMPISHAIRDLGNGQIHEVESIRSVLGRNVVDGQAGELTSAWQDTFAGIDAGPGVALSSEPPVLDGDPAWPTEREADDVEHDIVHITCHGNIDYNGKKVWSLTLQEPNPSRHYLDRDWVNHLDLGAQKPLVFANACGSVGAGGTTEVIPTFGQEFVEKGAHNFVGTFAPVTKDLALDFAGRFYEHLVSEDEDLTIGQALLATKLDFHQTAGQEDPSYLFYCLYGPPSARYRLAE